MRLFAVVVGPGDKTLSSRLRQQLGAAVTATGNEGWGWSWDAVPGAWDRLLLLRARMAAGADGGAPTLLRCGIGLESTARALGAYGRLIDAPQRRHRSRLTPFAATVGGVAWTRLEDGRTDGVRDALLAHMDALLGAWTLPQWQAIALVLEGLRYQEIGARLRISQQNVHKRVRAAHLPLFLQGHAALRQLLEN